MSELTGFPPVIDSGCRVLILGSMPSAESLRQHEYYAHPRNAFWSIIEKLFAIPRHYQYSERTRLLAENRVAVWDVLQSCIRQGSLDSAIEKGSESFNDFSRFFRQFPEIRAVFFNGGAAERLYKRYVLDQQLLPALTYHRLPSTSPAFAAMNFEEKLQEWQVLLDELN